MDAAVARVSLSGLLLAAVLSACQPEPTDESRPADSSPTAPTATASTVTPTPDPPPQPPPLGTVAPPWLGTRVLPETPEGYGEVRRTPPVMRERRWNTSDSIAPLPGRGFQVLVADPAPDDVIERSTWQPGCPVDRTELAWVRITYWGFDDRRHSGEMPVSYTHLTLPTNREV